MSHQQMIIQPSLVFFTPGVCGIQINPRFMSCMTSTRHIWVMFTPRHTTANKSRTSRPPQDRAYHGRKKTTRNKNCADQRKTHCKCRREGAGQGANATVPDLVPLWPKFCDRGVGFVVVKSWSAKDGTSSKPALHSQSRVNYAHTDMR